MKIECYHGTNCSFTKFKNETSDDTNIVNEIFFAKDIDEARNYANSRTEDLGGTETIIKAEIEINNPMSAQLEISLDKIMAYAAKEGKVEEYNKMYESFNGHDTREFAAYVVECEGEESGADAVRWLIEDDWGFDGMINGGNVYTIFSPERIKILEVTEEHDDFWDDDEE